jgi:menaquinone-dependent protoporphyrinogen oxidase
MKLKNVLIVYGSFLGSTKEISSRMKTTLENRNYIVDLKSADEKVPNLSRYDLIIIGSAIHGGLPHPAVLNFVKSNLDTLKKKRTAVFIVCMTIASTKADKKEAAMHYPHKVAAGFRPESTAVFAGTARDGGWFGNLVGELMLGVKPGDYRDWKKIESWTVSLVK